MLINKRSKLNIIVPVILSLLALACNADGMVTNQEVVFKSPYKAKGTTVRENRTVQKPQLVIKPSGNKTLPLQKRQEDIKNATIAYNNGKIPDEATYQRVLLTIAYNNGEIPDEATYQRILASKPPQAPKPTILKPQIVQKPLPVLHRDSLSPGTKPLPKPHIDKSIEQIIAEGEGKYNPHIGLSLDDKIKLSEKKLNELEKKAYPRTEFRHQIVSFITNKLFPEKYHKTAYDIAMEEFANKEAQR